MAHDGRLTQSQSYSKHSCPRLEILAERGASSFARIADLIARFDVLPTDWHARQSCAGLCVRVDVAIATQFAQRLAERLRATVGFQTVMLIIVPQTRDANAAHALSEHSRTCYSAKDEQMVYC